MTYLRDDLEHFILEHEPDLDEPHAHHLADLLTDFLLPHIGDAAKCITPYQRIGGFSLDGYMHVKREDVGY